MGTGAGAGTWPGARCRTCYRAPARAAESEPDPVPDPVPEPAPEPAPEPERGDGRRARS